MTVEDLTVAFGGVVAVENLDMHVAPGSVHAVIGPNGAGKTTLLNVIGGFYTPTAGRVLLDGKDLSGVAPWRRVSLGLGRTFQTPTLIDGLSVLDNVQVGMFPAGGSAPFYDAFAAPRARRQRRRSRERAAEALEAFRIEEYAALDVANLPLGARKLVDFARAWVMRPPVMLLDEPTAGLSANEIEGVGDLIERAKAHSTIIVIAHHIDFVMRVADVVTVLNFGREVATGPPEDVRANPEVVDIYIGARD